MKILVTGAAGFLGSHLAEALEQAGHTVWWIDDLSGGSLDNVQNKGRFAKLDIRYDLETWQFMMQECDAVYHCAATAYEGLSVFAPRLIVENVVVGSVTVATAAIRAGVKRFVNCSSMARYGKSTLLQGLPFQESYHCDPVDPYGAAKLQAEMQLNIIGCTHGMKVVHAVPHNIVGPRQRYDDPYRNVVSIFANRMLQSKPAIVYGDGEQRRCFSDIRDVVPVMLQLLTADVEHGEVFNVGPDDGEVTINRLAAIVAETLGFDGCGIIPMPARPCEVKVALCRSDKIRHRFGFQRRYSLRETVKSVVDWIKEKGPKPFRYNLPLEIVNDKTPRTWTEKLI